MSLFLSSSGAGAACRLWAPRGSGGESLLVSGDLTHRLLVLTWHSALPVDLHIHAEDDTLWPSRRRSGSRLRQHTGYNTYTLEWCLITLKGFVSPSWQDTTINLIHLFFMHTTCSNTIIFFSPISPCDPALLTLENHYWQTDLIPKCAFFLSLFV